MGGSITATGAIVMGSDAVGPGVTCTNDVSLTVVGALFVSA